MATLGARRSRSVASASVVCREECADAASPPPRDLPTWARTLRDRLQPLATDRLRIALALRSARTGNDLSELLTALAGHTDLAERLRILIARIAQPASIDAVADAAPEILALLDAVIALPPAAPGKTPRKRGRFWG